MATVRSIMLVYLAMSMVLLTISLPSSQAYILEFDIAPENGLAPDSDIIYSPEPAKDPALLICASRITLDCATEIISNDFFAVHFEAKCCKQLVRMGKTCNDLIVDDILADLKKTSTIMHGRSDHLWNKCLHVLSAINRKVNLGHEYDDVQPLSKTKAFVGIGLTGHEYDVQALSKTKSLGDVMTLVDIGLTMKHLIWGS